MNPMTGKIACLIALTAMFGLYACAHTASIATRHPVEVSGPQLCSDCHPDERASLDHTSDFTTRHRFYAEQQNRTCTICHIESFCANCHAHKEELKPSDKFKDSPELSMPHRGDYINQHKIDGRINPASCMKCHGRTNNTICIRCHKVPTR